MADSGESAAEEIISFELLPDFDLNESETDMQQLTQEQQEAVHRLMDTVNVSSAAENDADYQAFEEQAADFRHCRKTPEEVDAIAGKSQTQTTHWQTKWAVKVFKDWLEETSRDPVFETLPDEILAGHLRQFFAEVRKRNQQPYSKSGMINLRAGLNRYLQNPPNNRIINLMRNEQFQNANKVFRGTLRANKQEGHDVSRPKSAIAQQDLEKLYQEYFTPGLSNGNAEILQHKVFFDIVYHTGRQAKEGLRALSKSSFQLKVTPDGKEYIEQTFNQVSKKNQGDEMSRSYDKLHNEHPIILEQEENYTCPVNSFKHYTNLLNEKNNDFFQKPNKAKTGFDAAPLGKNTLGSMMKVISERAGLSRIYTNHEIRSTTATAMHKSNFGLKEIQNVTKHKNIQSLEPYVGGPTIEDKVRYSTALYNYANKKRPLALPDPQNEPEPSKPPAKSLKLDENEEKAIVSADTK